MTMTTDCLGNAGTELPPCDRPPVATLTIEGERVALCAEHLRRHEIERLARGWWEELPASRREAEWQRLDESTLRAIIGRDDASEEEIGWCLHELGRAWWAEPVYEDPSRDVCPECGESAGDAPRCAKSGTRVHPFAPCGVSAPGGWVRRSLWTAEDEAGCVAAEESAEA